MNSFTYQYPVRQHFGKGCAENAIKEEMKLVGKNVLLAPAKRNFGNTIRPVTD